jgi:thymidylate synthase (FAD)
MSRNHTELLMDTAPHLKLIKEVFMKFQLFDPLQDGISTFQLIDCMGSDLSVVNEARASVEAISTEFCQKDKDLLIHLLTSWPQHKSPLRGVALKFRVKAPLALARQWFKHVVASSHVDDQLQHNERSFRYSEAIAPEEFYIPKVLRTQSTRNKQSGADPVDPSIQWRFLEIMHQSCDRSFADYQTLITHGVCREQARFVLNPAIYTSWVWTTSLQAALNFLELRNHSAAQSEIAAYAECLEQAESLKHKRANCILRYSPSGVTELTKPQRS